MEAIGAEMTSAFSPAAERITTDVNGILGQSGASAISHVESMAVSTLASLVVTHFRAHGHINNVMTHISGARWDRVEDELRIILNTGTKAPKLTPLGENIIELLHAERGVTGRIVKPYFEALLAGLLPAGTAMRIRVHVEHLYRALEDSAKGEGRRVGGLPVRGRRKNALRAGSGRAGRR